MFEDFWIRIYSTLIFTILIYFLTSSVFTMDFSPYSISALVRLTSTRLNHYKIGSSSTLGCYWCYKWSYFTCLFPKESSLWQLLAGPLQSFNQFVRKSQKSQKNVYPSFTHCFPPKSQKQLLSDSFHGFPHLHLRLPAGAAPLLLLGKKTNHQRRYYLPQNMTFKMFRWKNVSLQKSRIFHSPGFSSFDPKNSPSNSGSAHWYSHSQKEV